MNLKKRKERTTALEILYQMEFQEKKDVEKYLKTTPQILVKGVVENKTKIDELISKHSQNWKMDRIALLDLNILRIAIYEIAFSANTKSFKIYINEAIEVAKIYGSKDSPRYINGILDSINKEKNTHHV